MNEIERLLEEAPLARPRDRLDERMDRLFSEPPRPRRILTRPVALWQTAAACIVCAILGFLAHRVPFSQESQQSEPHTMTFIIEAGTHVPIHAFDLTQRKRPFHSGPVAVRVLSGANLDGTEPQETI